jgi:hypothetical protein
MAISFNWRVPIAYKVTLPRDQAMSARYDQRLGRDTPDCWKGLVKTVKDRAEDCLDMIKQVPNICTCLPYMNV